MVQRSTRRGTIVTTAGPGQRADRSGAIVSGAGAAVPLILGIAPGVDTAIVTHSGGATLWRVNGGTASALGVSPATITGLEPGEQYDTPGLQIGIDGSVWSAGFAFGTENPATGGGGPVTELPIGRADSSETALALAIVMPIGVAEESEAAFALVPVLVPGIALESEEALALTEGFTIGAAESSEVALALLQALQPGVAEEWSQAYGLTLINVPGLAVESEQAFALTMPGRAAVAGAPRRRAINLSQGRRPANLS